MMTASAYLSYSSQHENEMTEENNLIHLCSMIYFQRQLDNDIIFVMERHL